MKNNNNKRVLVMCRIVKIFITGLLILIVTPPLPVWAYAFNINIDTTSLATTDVTLAFDFIDGDGPGNNTLQVSNFLTHGGSFDPTTAIGMSTGDVSGLLDSAVVMGDLSGFSEFLQPITLGTSFQFQLNTTNQFAAGGILPDEFSFFILDSSGILPLFSTTDGTGADALFALDLTGTGSGNLSVFASTSTQPNPPTWSVVPVQAVPEPAAFGLLLVGGWSVYQSRKRHEYLLTKFPSRGYKNASQEKSS
jgi:hypothetical protein